MWYGIVFISHKIYTKRNFTFLECWKQAVDMENWINTNNEKTTNTLNTTLKRQITH